MKKLVLALGFKPKENISDVFIKKYTENYSIEIDFSREIINWGKKIFIGEKNIQNITKPEDWVVLECVNRLIEKGYKPEDIVLEKVFPSGHGHSGRLDILVKKENKTFLMIECKTWGKEFEKEYKNLNKDGGQLFTYFQNDKNADFLVLYASKFEEESREISYKNEIVVINEAYKETANVKDLFERWNKQTKDNGVFEDWVNVYNFESRNLQMKDLKEIKQEDSSFIFNRFLEILRHNAVSDKGNAFTKIFTLFLCKVKDEGRNENEELDFQWIEGKDTPVSFQKRLSDLYKAAMKDFLDKEVTDFSDKDFEDKYGTLDESVKKALKEEFTKLRLQKSNEFAIKDVFNEETFLENNIVLREVVELLQNFKFRYNKKQPFLGEFFELLLTTGLKQESGQFFTPVPVARFICKSVPLREKTAEKLKAGTRDLLPNIIDYAAGSGHFLTEAMEELQNIIEKMDTNKFPRNSQKMVEISKITPFDWAYDYIYGIERDYRLVRTTKVGCYLHGDGVANVIHGDGLDSFAKSKTYRGKLKTTDENSRENGNFDFVLSNPPYSVSSFKGNTHNENFKKDFELYKNLTDQSSEIEALFIERTKQLLSEGGIAALILPASILSNTGIYTKSREIILKYFEIIAITELGSNTFMATGTSTVTLFMRRRSDYVWKKVAESVDGFFHDQKDKTVNGIENVFSKYVSHVFEDEDIDFADFQTFIAGNPNESIKKSEFFAEYWKKIKEKSEDKKLAKILETEKEKLLYFILAYPQEVVLVNSGQKKEEKRFLGYEFSARRGDEGLHAINRSKSVDECTSLYDDKDFYNPAKASTYILEAFEGKKSREISENLKKNISRVNLVDMLTFDRVSFEKTISTSVKKKIKIESQWEIVRIGDLCSTSSGGTPKSGVSEYYKNGNILWVNSGEVRNGVILNSENKITKLGLAKSSAKIFPKNTVLIAMYGATTGQVGILGVEASTNQAVCGILPNKKINFNYLYRYLDTQLENFISLSYGVARSNISQEIIKNFKIPLPPLNIQQKIVDECEKVDEEVKISRDFIEQGKREIEGIVKNIEGEKTFLGNVAEVIAGQSPKSEFYNEESIGLPFYQGKKDFGKNELQSSGIFTSKITKESLKGSILMSVRAPVGNVNINPFEKICIGRGLASINAKENCNQKFLFEIIKWNKQLFSGHKGATFDSISRSEILEVKIPLPNLKTQQKIVSEIEKIEAEISKNQKIIDEAGNKKEKILKKYL